MYMCVVMYILYCMYLCVYVYSCNFVCLYLCVSVLYVWYMYMSSCIHMYICIACICVYVSILMYVYAYVCVLYMWYASVCVCIHIYVCAVMYVCVYVRCVYWVCICVHVCTPVCIYTRILMLVPWDRQFSSLCDLEESGDYPSVFSFIYIYINKTVCTQACVTAKPVCSNSREQLGLMCIQMGSDGECRPGTHSSR